MNDVAASTLEKVQLRPGMRAVLRADKGTVETLDERLPLYRIKKRIGCAHAELIGLPHDLYLVVDEDGSLRRSPRRNAEASRIYREALESQYKRSFPHAIIVGDAVIVPRGDIK